VVLQENMKSSIVVVNIKDLKSEEHQFPATYATLINFQQGVISQDGKRIFITDANIAGIRVLSTTTLRLIQTLSWEQNIQYPMGIAMQLDDSRLFIAGFFSGNMAMINQIS
jgi:DNA-binding beta-propeller fold protein YncE